LRNTRHDWGTRLLNTYLVLFFAYLISPLLIIFITSLNSGLNISFPPTHVSTEWYVNLWSELRGVHGVAFQPGLLRSIWTSLWLSMAATAGAVLAGVLAALGLNRLRFPGREPLRQSFLLPLLFPQIVTGVALALWFSTLRGVPAWTRLMLGHLILTLPYVVVTTGASLETLDQQLENAAMNLGARPLQAFWYVVLPSIRSGVIAGAMFASLVSFSNFTVSFFLFSGGVKPLPVWIYEVMSYHIDPSVAALGSFLILLTLFVFVILRRLFFLGRLVGLRR
jgi:putative spermidine/putrescine transport system permease protein